MRIAVLFPNTQFCSWSSGRGLANTLRRMGHEPISIPMPTARETTQQQIAMVRAQSTPIEVIKRCDLAIVSGPEHIGPWIDAIWGQYEWKNLGIPRAAWLHESVFREDQVIEFDSIKMWADEWFVPAVQDSDYLDQESFAKGHVHWLPFGVDTEVFKPYWTTQQIFERTGMGYFEHSEGGVAPAKDIPIGFLGLMYPKRQIFLQALSKHDHPPIKIAMVGIQDMDGYNYEKSADLLAQSYRRCKVFFNLPAMSRLLVGKIVEVMACGGFLMTPELPPEGGVAKNMEPFKSGEHLIYYRSSNLGYVAQLLRDWSGEDKAEERERIAEAGCKHVHEQHSLDVRFEQMFAALGINTKVSVL
jgi:hypothetical protein